MFGHLIRRGTYPSDGLALVVAGDKILWPDLVQISDRLFTDLQGLQGCRVGLVMYPSASCLAALAALDDLCCQVYLIDPQLSHEAMLEMAKLRSFRALVVPSAADPRDLDVHQTTDFEPEDSQRRVVILTSGTTGTPKAARYTWKALLGPVRPDSKDLAANWLLTYRPHLYAGIQVMAQCLVNQGTLVVPRTIEAPDEVIQMMVLHSVNAVSATPSYWRRLAMFGDQQQLETAPVNRVTLGGEIVDQKILDLLAGLYPNARITHIYATTELGRCFSVSDRQAGFPVNYLKEVSRDGIALKVDKGQLWVRPVYSMEQYDPTMNVDMMSLDLDDPWRATGDLVEVRGDRVYFVGRDSDLINVGGNKVAPGEVEEVLRALKQIADVRVYGQTSSLAGQIVACDVVLVQGADETVVRQTIHQVCAKSFQPHQQPRLIRFVEAIPLTEAGKTARQSG